MGRHSASRLVRHRPPALPRDPSAAPVASSSSVPSSVPSMRSLANACNGRSGIPAGTVRGGGGIKPAVSPDRASVNYVSLQFGKMF